MAAATSEQVTDEEQAGAAAEYVALPADDDSECDSEAEVEADFRRRMRCHVGGAAVFLLVVLWFTGDLAILVKEFSSQVAQYLLLALAIYAAGIWISHHLGRTMRKLRASLTGSLRKVKHSLRQMPATLHQKMVTLEHKVLDAPHEVSEKVHEKVEALEHMLSRLREKTRLHRAKTKAKLQRLKAGQEVSDSDSDTDSSSADVEKPAQEESASKKDSTEVAEQNIMVEGMIQDCKDAAVNFGQTLQSAAQGMLSRGGTQDSQQCTPVKDEEISDVKSEVMVETPAAEDSNLQVPLVQKSATVDTLKTSSRPLGLRRMRSCFAAAPK